MKDVKISDYLWFQEGPGVRNTQYTTSGVKLINVANLVDGNVDLSTSDRYISEEEAYGKYNHFLADDGDFVIASSGIKIDYFDKKMGFIKKEHLPLCMNTSCIRFKVLDTNNLEIKYFMYYLKSNSFKKQLFNQITGSAQLNFGPSHLKKMTFPLIELKEQKRIIERLDKTQNIINETKYLLSKYDTLIKSRFIEMFGDPVTNSKNWNLKKLGDLLESIRYGTSTPPVFSKTGYAFIRATNIKKGKIVNDDMKYISEEETKKISKCKLNGNEILIVRSGVNSGDTCVVTKEYINQYAGYDMILVLGNQINPIYLNELLNTNYMEKMIKPLTRRAAQPHLNSEQTQSLPIILPPLSLQNDFAAFVQQIDKSKFVIWRNLELCVIIIQKVFLL